MSTSQGFRLRLRAAPGLRVELDGIVPMQCAGTTPLELAARTVRCGNERIALGELFDVTAFSSDTPTLELEGDLARFDGIGRGLDGGLMRVEGDVGDHVGAMMSAGAIEVSGSASILAACEMSGGRLEVRGNVGDHAAGALPGSMDGMRGGVVVVRGNAGARFGDRMRRGTALICGDAGDFLASRMVAGTIAVAGAAGAHCGYAMRRGTLVFCGPQPAPPPTFAATVHDVSVFWALLTRNLAYHGGDFAGLARRRPQRFVGDLSADGKGEWLLPV